MERQAAVTGRRFVTAEGGGYLLPAAFLDALVRRGELRTRRLWNKGVRPKGAGKVQPKTGEPAR